MVDSAALELWLVIGAVVAFGLWALRYRRKMLLSREFRVYPEDLWRLMFFVRGDDIWVNAIEQIVWNPDSDTDGVVHYKGGVQAIMSQHIDHDTMTVETTLAVITSGEQPGETMRTLARVQPVQDGARYDLAIIYTQIGKLGFKGWFGRIFRPLTGIHMAMILRGELERSGAFARYAAVHGEPAGERSVLGMRMSVNALVLAALALAWWGWSFGLWFTVALATGLVLHEAGHVAVMRMMGDRASAFYFVPFLGGIAIGRMQNFTDRQRVAMVLGGPLAGLISAVAAFALGVAADNDYLKACGSMFAMFNLFNLLPLTPLDGGQVMMTALRAFLPDHVLHWVNTALFAMGGALSIWIKAPILAVMFTLFCVLAVVYPPAKTTSKQQPLSKQEAAVALGMLIALAACLLLVLKSGGQAMSFTYMVNVLVAGPFDD